MADSGGYREGWLVVVDLQHAFGDRVVWTRFVAPAEPIGAWKEYSEEYDFALQPADAPCYRLVEDPGPHPVIDEPTFGKWGPHLLEIVGEGPLTVVGVATDCCVLSTVLPAADAGVGVRVVTDACAGSSDDDHERALHLMDRYSPLVRLATTAEVLAG